MTTPAEDPSSPDRSSAPGAAAGEPTQPARDRAANAPNPDRRGVGILLVIAGSMAMTGVDSSAKWLLLNGFGAGQSIFVRFLLPCIVLTLIFLPRHGLAVVRTQSLKLEVARAVSMITITGLNFMALRHLPMTITGSIAFSSPLIICLLSGFALGERIDWQRWIAVIAGFVGVLIIINPDSVPFHPAMLYSLGVAVMLAVYAILTRKLAGVDSNVTQQFYASFVGLLFSLPFAFQQWTWPQSAPEWFVCALIGTAGLLGHILYSAGHLFAPATTLAPFTYTQLIFMALVSWLVFAQGPDVSFFIGLPILVGSGLFIWFREFSIATRGRSA
ncbi:DMT family transporter [Pseudochelatococcus sp. B33]